MHLLGHRLRGIVSMQSMKRDIDTAQYAEGSPMM